VLLNGRNLDAMAGPCSNRSRRLRASRSSQYTQNLQAHEAKLQSENDAQISLTMVNEDLNQ
jgi:hypothetical protein